MCSWPLCPEPGPALRHPTRGGGGSRCDTQHSWLPGHATRRSQRLRAGLAPVAVGESERTPPSIVARQVTQGSASPETAARTAAGANGQCLWDSLGARAQFQPVQDGSTWLNKPFCVFRSLCFLRGARLQAGGPVTPHHVLTCPFPHCSQSTATRVRGKWGKGHATRKPQVALSCWRHPEGGWAYQGRGQNQGALGLAQGQGQVGRLGGVSAS